MAVAYDTQTVNSPPRFHLLAKPSGSTCNIDCKYCFFLSKEALYPDQNQRMSDLTLETYIRQYIHQTHLLKLVSSPEERKLGDDKRDTSTPVCQYCEVRSLCNGGCPRDRFVVSSDGHSGRNYLCPGPDLFFTHTRPVTRTMAELLQRGRAPSDVMALIAATDAKRKRVDPYPCGSGRKFRSCHGDKAPRSTFSGVSPPRDTPRDVRVEAVQVESTISGKSDEFVGSLEALLSTAEQQSPN